MKDSLEFRLRRLAEKTGSAEALDPGGYWVGDVAGERRVRDDLAGGRLHWRSAHNNAMWGIKAFESGDLEAAQTYAWMATDFYIEALEARVRPEDVQALGRPSQRRGRPKKNSKK